MSLKRFLKATIRGRAHLSYEPLITVAISKSSLLHNISEFRKLTNRPVAPVLKSNAYGHGLIDVARIMDGINPPFMVVDSLFEATALRAEGIRSDILIIGYTRASDIASNKLRGIAFTITSLQALVALGELLLDESGDIKIHLKIDTGMRRQGVLIDEIDEAIAIIKRTPSLTLTGVCSHFADADMAASEYTSGQIKTWNDVASKFRKSIERFPDLRHFHVSNSAGHAYEGSIDATVSRLGIGLYGIDSSETLAGKIHQQPVLSVTTLISSIKTIPARESVGYNGIFKSTRQMTLATIPMGYFEGVDRRLSNKGFVYVRGIACPIVGRVSMNISTIDVSEIKGIQLDEPVEVISSVAAQSNSIASIARICETIPYEIAVHVGMHLRRVVVD